MSHLNRRELLRAGIDAALGGAGIVLFNGCSHAEETRLNPGSETGPCPLNPEQEEGPFYVDEGLLRSDVLEGEAGVPLLLSIKVIRAAKCEPIANAALEIWSANRFGKYSDKSQEGTLGQKYLRGVQISDAEGVVQFKTVYPGWYSGRTSHIHLKVRTGGTASGSNYSTAGSTTAYGGQLFFPTSTNQALRYFYSADKNSFTNNDQDWIYTRQHGQRGLVSLDGTMDAGFKGSITVAVNS